MKAVWAKISKINVKYRASSSLLLEENGKLISDPGHVANRMARPFLTVGENMNRSKTFIRYKPQIARSPLRLEEDDMESYYSAIRFGELIG